MALETVLVAVGDHDDSRVERLAKTTIDLAASRDLTVVVAHVFPDDMEPTPGNTLPIAGTHQPYVLSHEEYEEVTSTVADEADGPSVDDAAARDETVEALTARLDEAGVDYVIRGAVGDPSDTVVTLAEEVDADRVVVGGRRRSPTDKVIFGSVAQTVLLQAPCPVTFVRDT